MSISMHARAECLGRPQRMCDGCLRKRHSISKKVLLLSPLHNLRKVSLSIRYSVKCLEDWPMTERMLGCCVFSW